MIDAPQMRELCERFEGLIGISEPALRKLANILAGTDYAVLLTDSRGVVLQHIVEAGIEQEFRKAGLCLGSDWGESWIGTNGIGTCIAEQRPVTVHKDDHLLRQNIDLTCSAAPIHDPHGNLMAVLVASSCSSADSRSSQTHTPALVAAYARLIESQHFLREFRNQKILRYQDRAELVTLPDKALEALSEDNRVLAANDVTMRLLGIAERTQIVGKEISEILGNDLDNLIDGGSHSPETIHPFKVQRSGAQFYDLLYRHKIPKRRRGLSVPPTTFDPDDCRRIVSRGSLLSSERHHH